MADSTAYIGLGSNLGDRESHLRSAIRALANLGTVTAQSSLYQTAPVGGPPQPDYLNAVVALSTPLDPINLLEELFAIERAHGRTRTGEKNLPRPLDLDLLLVAQDGKLLVIDSPENEPRLALPHPHLHTRLFVLAPLAEIASSLEHPFLHRTIAALRDQLLAGKPLPQHGVALFARA